MFSTEDCFQLGHIAKLRGFKGEVSVFLDVDNPHEYKDLESVFVEIDGKLVPFFLEQIRVQNSGFAVVKFELIDSEKKAEKLRKCRLFLPLDLLPETEGTEFYHFEIKGFKVIDEEHGDIGIVTGILDISSNPLIQIDANGTEIMIPKQDNFIQKIDRENEVVYIKAPDGLIDMYLGA